MYRILTAILCIFLMVNSKSQHLQFGIKLDPQISWFSVAGENFKSIESQAGLNVGLVMDRRLTENYFFNTGISISMAGGGIVSTDTFSFQVNYNVENVEPNQSQQYHLQSVQIPVGLKFKTENNRNYLFYGEIGVDLMLRLHANLQSGDTQNTQYNVSKEVNTFNFGYHIGGGIEVDLNNRCYLQTGVVFTQGLMDVFCSEDVKVIQNIAGLRCAVFF